MTNLIQLESLTCPKCGVKFGDWTLKPQIVDGALGVSCQFCGTFVRFIVKGGESEKAIGVGVAETTKQTKEE